MSLLDVVVWMLLMVVVAVATLVQRCRGESSRESGRC